MLRSSAAFIEDRHNVRKGLPDLTCKITGEIPGSVPTYDSARHDDAPFGREPCVERRPRERRRDREARQIDADVDRIGVFLPGIAHGC